MDTNWLKSAIGEIKTVYCLNNHYRVGGQADSVALAIGELNRADILLVRLGVNDIPPCGTNQQLLDYVGLDKQGIVRAIAGR